MSETRKCGRCGSDVEGAALFCSKCGQDMTLVGDDAPTLAVTTDGTPVQPVRSTMRQALRDATLGEYEILSELGRGGMATVFLAHDIALDRKVAIKVMAPHLLEGEGMAERFKLEARTAAQLSHPHIIPIYAVKETPDTLYFVMKYVEGRGLDQVVRKMGPMPIPTVRDILTKVGSALGYAHRRDVVHRDIKPGNIMIDEEGTPIVTDFGIAKVAETKGLTMTGTTIGTPSYMSPEQCEAKAVTGASDQYSLGIVAFEILTGKLPFEGDSAVTIMYKHCHEPLPPLDDFRPDCPAEIRDTVVRMVAKDPAERWPSLEAAVRKLSDEPTPTVGHDPVRSQLMELVEDGDADELLARLSDPSGLVAAGTGGRAARTAGGGARSRTRLVAAAAIVAVLGIGGTLAVLQPWAGEAPATTAGDPGSGQAPEAGAPVTAAPAEGGVAVQNEPTANGETGGGAGDTGGPAAGGAPPANPGATSGGGTSPSGGGATPPAGPTVARVEIAAAPTRLEPDGSADLAARAVDAGGNVVPGAAVSWASDDESVARVDDNGRVTAVGPGEAVLTATAGGRSESVTLTVSEASVMSVTVDRTGLEMTVGDAPVQLRAQPRGANGAALAGRTVSWSSSNESVARVDDDGRVTATGPGDATVTATSAGIPATARVTVRLDARTAIEGLIEAYAQALESLEVPRVRAAYPGLTAERATQLENLFRNSRDMQVDYIVGDIDDRGTTATAQVTGTWRFVDSRAGAQQLPQNTTATFERTASGWRMTAIQ